MDWQAAGWPGRFGSGGLMLAAGALHTAAFAPLEAWYLQLPLLALLATAVARVGWRRAAWLGSCFGVGWLGCGLWWLYISMHDFGGVPAVLAALAVLLLSVFLSLHLAVGMALAAGLRQGRPVADALVFAACWLAAELSRAQMFSGFPWIASGYVHTSGPWAALAPWVGVYGLGALSAWAAAAVAQWMKSAGPLATGATAQPPVSRHSAWLGLAFALSPLFVGALLPHAFTQASGPLSVSLVQTHVPQDIKFDPDRILGNMVALRRQMHAATGELVLAPESVLPLSQDQLPDGYWNDLTLPYRRGPQSALIGIFLGNSRDGFVNSLAGIRPGPPGAEPEGFYSYGKRHLLPFGEFIPPGFHWFVTLMGIPLADQASGRSEKPFEVAGQRVRPLICYEDLFGEDFAASFLSPETEPTVLANVSNLAWFGHLMIQDQHLQFSRMRVLEFQRPLVRATNTGATAALDHEGRVLDRLPAWTQGTLDVVVQGRRGLTPYAQWLGRFGLWPLWGLVALVLALCRWLPERPSGAKASARAAQTPP